MGFWSRVFGSTKQDPAAVVNRSPAQEVSLERATSSLSDISFNSSTARYCRVHLIVIS